jgi:uncharacterized cupin superfamily protein
MSVGKPVPKIDTAAIPVEAINIYPEEYAYVVSGREKQRISDVVGLTQFGVNRVRLKPGATSSLRHWHEIEDEMIYVLEGEVTLVEEDGESLLRAGDAAAFKAKVRNGHHLVNKSDQDVVFLEIGTRAAWERSTYVDIDLMLERDQQGRRFLHKSGEPYAPAGND